MINTIQTGASRQGLNHQQVRSLQIPLPPVPLQREFAARVGGEVRELERRQAESRRRLDALFAALLDRAFNGAL
jgi:type I restriction enzyme S subunit